MLSAMPEEDDTTFGMTEENATEPAQPKPAVAAAPAASDPFDAEPFSAKAIQEHMTPDSATCRIKTNFRERSGFCHSNTLKRRKAGSSYVTGLQ